jgi:hypothetical protein
MPRYRVYGVASLSVVVGEYEADSPAQAEKMADEEGEWSIALCHQCAYDVDLGDINSVEIEEIT